jgi:hypothetical protein
MASSSFAAFARLAMASPSCPRVEEASRPRAAAPPLTPGHVGARLTPFDIFDCEQYAGDVASAGRGVHSLLGALPAAGERSLQTPATARHGRRWRTRKWALHASPARQSATQ